MVRDASIKKREIYENILNNWPLLNPINDSYEKTKIAEILIEANYKKNNIIVNKVTNRYFKKFNKYFFK